MNLQTKKQSIQKPCLMKLHMFNKVRKDAQLLVLMPPYSPNFSNT